MDCYEAYAGYSSNPHVVYDIHVAADAKISIKNSTIACHDQPVLLGSHMQAAFTRIKV